MRTAHDLPVWFDEPDLTSDFATGFLRAGVEHLTTDGYPMTMRLVDARLPRVVTVSERVDLPHDWPGYKVALARDNALMRLVEDLVFEAVGPTEAPWLVISWGLAPGVEKVPGIPADKLPGALAVVTKDTGGLTIEARATVSVRASTPPEPDTTTAVFMSDREAVVAEVGVGTLVDFMMDPRRHH